MTQPTPRKMTAQDLTLPLFATGDASAAAAAPAVAASRPRYVPPVATIDLSDLNPAQREAAECTHGPLLVLAGAGSGKTRVLTYRIAHMIADEGVRPWQILAITFTNKAAAEMRERLGALLPGGTRGMWVCTFHAMCVRILRDDADKLGFRPNFTIYDDDDSKRLVKQIMSDLGIEPKQFPINGIRSRISSAKNALVLPDEFEGRPTRRPCRLPRASTASCRFVSSAPTPWTSTTCSSTRTGCCATTRRCWPSTRSASCNQRGRVPGHQPRSVADHQHAGRPRAQPHGRGR